MNRVRSSEFLVSAFWTGWRRWAVWLICIGVILLLGALRAATDAELAFASFALLPVLVMAWVGGRTNALIIAFLGAAMWAVGDLAAARQFSAPWIPWANAFTRLVIYGLVAVLAAQVRLQLEEEHENASRDALTGLQNRRAFDAAGASEVARATRYHRPLTVVFLDLDNFKQLNDTEGHEAGDMALRATAGALIGVLRASDHVGRLGGDEFAVLLPEIGYEAAVETGRKISVAVNSSLKGFPPVSASVGLVWFGDIDRPFPEMLTAADELMYEVKKSRKGDLLSRRITAKILHDPDT